MAYATRSEVDFSALYEGFLNHLLHQVIPFWTSRALDRARGGLFTFIENDGTIRSRNKHLVSNTRALWTFSALANRIENRPLWREAAEGIFHFLLRCGRDKNGMWVYVVDKDENVLVGESSIVTAAFAIGGLVEYYRMTGNADALQVAMETASSVRDRLAQPGNYKTEPYPTPPGMIAHREAMQFSRAFCELGSVAGDARILEEGLRYGRLVLDAFWRPERGVLLEYLGADGKPRNTPAGRTMVPGHALESLWFQMENFKRHGGGERHRAVEAACAVRPCLERGWDRKEGGILLGLDVNNLTPVYWKSAELKRWWPVTEAFPALLLAYEHVGEQWCLDWFETVRTWAFEKFPNTRDGDWYQNLTREATPITDVPTLAAADTWTALDLAVKDPFHLPRGLIVSIETLRRLIDRKEKIPR